MPRVKDRFPALPSIPLKEISDEAVQATATVEHVVVYRRIGIEVAMQPSRDMWWHDLVKDLPNFIAPEPVGY